MNRALPYLHRLALAFMILQSNSLIAQDELEYKFELGSMIGGMSYMGDANPSGWFSNTSFCGGAIGRWNINPRMALKGNITYGKISGNANELEKLFGDVPGQTWSFDHALVDASCTYELHFWGYGTGKSYKGTHRLVPYIQIGMGGTFCNNIFAINFPIGVGVKYKISNRLNIGLDWAMHISMSDKLDGIADPYNMESGAFKNTDTYSTTMLYLSYDFMPKLRKCNN